VDRNLEIFSISHAQLLFIFGQCVDLCNQNLFCEKKSRGNGMSKIVESTQSCTNGHLPYHCLFYVAWRALDG